MSPKPVVRRLVAVALLAATVTQAQSVDPTWLRHWERAWAAKPTIVRSVGAIAGAKEPGTPMVIHGRVVDPDGAVAAGVLAHAYHRDADGYEFGAKDRATATWRLQGWARTDAEGTFEFRTIRPAPDALGREAAHVHFDLISDRYGRQWPPKVWFADDPLVTDRERRRSQEAGEFGAVRQVRAVAGVQHLEVILQLKPEGDF